MSSRADNVASNFSFANFTRATELKKRIWFTLGALIVFRFLAFVPMPGINPLALKEFMDRNAGGILDFLNMFSGGALANYSLISLGVMPYITASIVMQLAGSLVPSLAALKKEGESGRRKLNQYSRYGTVLLSMVQGFAVLRNADVQGFAVNPNTLFYVAGMVSLVGGTMFLLWLGEQITSRGIGNGTSLIIMAGIVAQMPMFIVNMFSQGSSGQLSGFAIVGMIALLAFMILFICFMERATRRLLIQYPKRATQRGMMQADRSHLPLKLNTSGVIPPIFASSLLLLPLTITSFAGSSMSTESGIGSFIVGLNNYLGHGKPAYMGLYALGIIFFCFFYTAIVFNPEETAENLKRNGGFIPGIRPGKTTSNYLDYVLTRVTVIGAAYLTIVCVVPEYIIAQAGAGMFFAGGTSLLIVVNVTVDTITQIQSHLLAHQYGDLIKKAKLKGRVR